MKDLYKDDLEWLIKPDDLHPEFRKIIHINNDFAIGTDGYRAHIINVDNMPEKIENFPMKDTLVEKFDKFTTIEKVIISPRYLIDALETMKNSKRITLSIAIEDNSFIAVKIEDEDEEKTAIIMCIKNRGEDE